jgi:23S rRNA (pseudouridine1915-N3)-methyltransferase
LIRVLFVGKPRDKHSIALTEEFVRRCSRWREVDVREIVPSRYDVFAKHSNAAIVLLDPRGQQMSSPEFASWLERSEASVKDIIFYIGGAEGHSDVDRAKARLLLSLSKMTLAHEMARALLAEQIYRALGILNNHPYPRES